MSLAPRHIPHYTIEDYQHWEGDWELIDGVAISMSPSPFAPHERIVTRLSFEIRTQMTNQNCNCEIYTNLDWIVTNDTVIRPDLMVICGEQPQKHLERPPALMVEVLSESTEVTDRNAKRSIAREQHVSNYLIICQKSRTIIEASGSDLVDVDLTKSWEIILNEDCRIQINAAELFDLS